MKLSDEMRTFFQARYIMEKSQLNKKLQNAEELNNNWMVKQHYIDVKVKEAHNQLDDYLRDNDLEILPCGSGECVSSENYICIREESMDFIGNEDQKLNELLDELAIRNADF